MVAERTGQAGFTLIELTLALAIIAASMMTLLYLRTEAVERLIRFTSKRDVQQLAAKRLDEVVFGIVEDLEGDFSDEGEETIRWSIELIPIGQEEIPLLECTITVTYPMSKEETEDYRLTMWFYPDEESPLLPAAGIILDEDEENF